MEQLKEEIAWQPGLWTTLAFSALLFLLLALASWQVIRGEDKERLYQLYATQAGEAPAELLPGEPPSEFFNIKLSGRFEPNRVLFVSSKLPDGKPGYVVLHSFVDFFGRRWLINRGLVPLPIAPRIIDLIGYPDPYSIELTGTLWPDHGAFFWPVAKMPDGWPKHIDRLDWDKLSEAGLQNYISMEVRLDANHQASFIAQSREIRPLARQHRAYAVQWFGLAIILLASYVLQGISRTPH